MSETAAYSVNVTIFLPQTPIMFRTSYFSTLFSPPSCSCTAKRRMNEQYLAAAATESSPDWTVPLHSGCLHLLFKFQAKR